MFLTFELDIYIGYFYASLPCLTPLGPDEFSPSSSFVTIIWSGIYVILCKELKETFNRTSVQKSNKNEIFMARVKNSNCLNFCTQVDPSKTRKAVYFFPQMYFNFREKRTFRFHPLESMNRVITGRKLNTFARFAFQRYFIKGNLTNACSVIDSSSSV